MTLRGLMLIMLLWGMASLPAPRPFLTPSDKTRFQTADAQASLPAAPEETDALARPAPVSRLAASPPLRKSGEPASFPVFCLPSCPAAALLPCFFREHPLAPPVRMSALPSSPRAPPFSC